MRIMLIAIVVCLVGMAAHAEEKTKTELIAWKKQVEKANKQTRDELNQWKMQMVNSGLSMVGKSPMGFTHTTPGQDPSLVSTWRDPMAPGDAPDAFSESTEQIKRLEEELEVQDHELKKVTREIEEKDKEKSGGSEGGGCGGGC